MSYIGWNRLYYHKLAGTIHNKFIHWLEPFISYISWNDHNKFNTLVGTVYNIIH